MPSESGEPVVQPPCVCPTASPAAVEALHDATTSVADTVDGLTEEETLMLLDRIICGEIHQVPSQFDFSQSFRLIGDAVQTLASDRFSECFDLPDGLGSRPWNWNAYLWPCWVIGVVFRFAFLLPIRAFICFATLAIVFTGILVCKLIPRNTHKQELFFIRLLLKSLLVGTSAVIRINGAPPPRRPRQIFVANHTSPFDWVYLSAAVRPFAAVGQKQKGFFHFLQKYVLPPLDCLWFDRSDMRDRSVVAQKMREHSEDLAKCPLLLFPEGVCVNNHYAIMFKRGAFAVDDVRICPVSIKYNFAFSNPYWNSRKHSFFMFVISLFCSWSVVIEISFLPETQRHESEDPGAFASRVRAMIAASAGLEIRNFDGYFKYMRPSERYLETRKRQFLSSVLIDDVPVRCTLGRGADELPLGRSCSAISGVTTPHSVGVAPSVEQLRRVLLSSLVHPNSPREDTHPATAAPAAPAPEPAATEVAAEPVAAETVVAN